MTTDPRLQLRNKILGVLIRDARLAARMTQAECASTLGMSAGRFANIERGKRPISLPELELFAFQVDVPIDHLLGNKPLEEPEKERLPAEQLLWLRRRMVGALLRQERQKAGRTQKECAKEIAVPSSRISAYERGQTDLPLAELEVLAEFLRVPLESFLADEHGPIARKLRRDRALERFYELPNGLQEFILDPVNVQYLQTAHRLSQMSAERLRAVAEAVLEITY